MDLDHPHPRKSGDRRFACKSLKLTGIHVPRKGKPPMRKSDGSGGVKRAATAVAQRAVPTFRGSSAGFAPRHFERHGEQQLLVILVGLAQQLAKFHEHSSVFTRTAPDNFA